jgi:hypothetical protein
MFTQQQNWTLQLTALGLCGVALLNTGFAAPPALHTGMSMLHAASTQVRTNTPAGSATRSQRLDLRLPTSPFDTSEREISDPPSARGATEFGSFHRRALGGGAAPPSQSAQGNAALPSTGRIRSPMEELARRVHREGLPVARLWENKSALVSLGLNQKGKPGLWLVQKVH